MTRSLFYDMHGVPIDLFRWARLIEDEACKRVAEDRLCGAVVSTVWLGLDHGRSERRPLIFESMVFGGPLDGECRRYPTREAAGQGHSDLVDAVREAAKGGAGDAHA